MKSEAEISFRTMNGKDVAISPVPVVQKDAGLEVYFATTPEPFVLVIADRICIDTMSGMPHPSTVMIQSAGAKYEGCGGEPASLLLGEWVVEQIEGKPILAEAPPSIKFDADGKLSGAGSCNSFFGQYEVTGEGLAISTGGLSRMACAQPVMDQERLFLAALAKTSRFEIRADKALALYAPDGRSIVARGF